MQMRLIVTMAIAAATMTGSVAWLVRSQAARAAAMSEQEPYEIKKTDAEWREQLSDGQYYVLRKRGTESPGWSPLNHEQRDGTYRCAACGQVLFSSETKYDSGSGWPSFFAPLDGAVGTTSDTSHGMTRTEVHCQRCGGHLGHVFTDGPRPTGLRYCMNGVALRFVPLDEPSASK